MPRRWASNPDGYPTKWLHLDLLHGGSQEEQLTAAYRFRFLTKDEAAATGGGPRGWFRVGEVLSFKDSGPAMVSWLKAGGLLEEDGAYDRLYTLFRPSASSPR